jgi:hypothetical protein
MQPPTATASTHALATHSLLQVVRLSGIMVGWWASGIMLRADKRVTAHKVSACQCRLVDSKQALSLSVAAVRCGCHCVSMSGFVLKCCTRASFINQCGRLMINVASAAIRLSPFWTRGREQGEGGLCEYCFVCALEAITHSMCAQRSAWRSRLYKLTLCDCQWSLSLHLLKLSAGAEQPAAATE